MGTDSDKMALSTKLDLGKKTMIDDTDSPYRGWSATRSSLVGLLESRDPLHNIPFDACNEGDDNGLFELRIVIEIAISNGLWDEA